MQWLLLALAAWLFGRDDGPAAKPAATPNTGTGGGGFKQAVALATVPGTLYGLRGGALSPDLRVYVSPAGCVMVRSEQVQGQPKPLPMSIPVTRQDGEATTYTLPGLWSPAPGQDLAACYAKVEPQTHFARLMGNLGAVPGMVAASVNSTVGEARALLAKAWPEIAPLLALAEEWTGIDAAAQATALLAGAADAGVPVDSIGQLVTNPEAAIKAAASAAKQRLQESAQGVLP
jgi:hypothetical protein